MNVAAYQAPLLPAGSMDTLRLIRTQIDQCEAEGVGMLCCPEAILGGLADYSGNPAHVAIAVDDRLNSVLAPLASDTVTTIIGFTEVASGLVRPDGSVVRTARPMSDDLIIAEVETVPSPRR